MENLQTICDTLYFAQDYLLGGIIEAEKDFSIYEKDGNVVLSYIDEVICPKEENSACFDHYTTQIIYVNENTKMEKLIKDIITEMEVIYNI